MLDINQKTEFYNINYDSLQSICKSCTKCALHKERKNVVVGHGPVPCNVMIIGEGPGQQEDEQAIPFIGRSGQLLTKILESAGINRNNETFITNTVKCRPPKNRTPLSSEIKACKPYLVRQIQLVQPRIIILLGSPSLKTILEEQLAISKVRGKWYTTRVNYMKEPLQIMPMFHPSYLLRNPSKEKGKPVWLTSQDAKTVKTKLDMYNIK